MLTKPENDTELRLKINRETARLPWYTRGILEVEVTGRQGVTPYVRWGDALPALAALLVTALGFLAGRRRGPR